MDEMRQLVRILVALFPESRALITSDLHCVSAGQIRMYLAKSLGDAPQPDWSLPNGWGEYLAQLFTWALDRPVTEDEAMLCVYHSVGQSWAAVEEELAKLGE
jgi:hypothetical protein